MIAAVLLAAGDGKRFGGDKLLAPIGGVAMVVHAARALSGAVDRIVAPVRPTDRTLIALLAAEGVETVGCASAEGGMGFSIACGVRAASGASGWLVALGDMPFIAPATLTRIRLCLDSGAPLVAATYRGQQGHPVGFAAQFGRELTALTGDAGARRVIAAHPEKLVTLPCDDPGILRDIDWPADLAAAIPGSDL